MSSPDPSEVAARWGLVALMLGILLAGLLLAVLLGLLFHFGFGMDFHEVARGLFRAFRR